jgi:hypothetical protein
MGSFERMRPFATPNSVRLVLVNRRDFPWSEPYTEAEHVQLVSARVAPEGEEVALFETIYVIALAKYLTSFAHCLLTPLPLSG